MLPAGGLPLTLTQISTPNRASIISSSGGPACVGQQTGWSVSDRRQIQRLSNGTLTQTVPAPASTTSPERGEDMRPSRPWVRLMCPRLALLLSLMPLAGLSSYGPASSDNAPNLEPRANVGRPPLSEQGPSPGNDPVTPAASPVPLASGLAPAGQGDARSAAPLVVPAWMAKELDSPDVHAGAAEPDGAAGPTDPRPRGQG